MDSSNKSSITRTGDYLIIPAAITLDEILSFQHTPKLLKKAVETSVDRGITLEEALKTEPYLMPVITLADGMMERNKGDWSIKVDYGVEIKGGSGIRIDLYGIESSFYKVRGNSDGSDGGIYILAGVATIQNANVPDWRVVFGKEGGVIFRDKKLEGIIQGQRIQDAKSRKREVLEAYSDLIGEERQEWLILLEEFLETSGL